MTTQVRESVTIPYDTFRRMTSMVRNIYNNIKDVNPDKISDVTEFFVDGKDDIQDLYDLTFVVLKQVS
jgi:hypothetical protein